MFLKLDGISGEAQDSKHSGEIAVDGMDWGAENQSSLGRGTGGGAGKGMFRPMSVIKRVDKSSPDLMLYCVSGKHIPSGLLTVREAGGEQPVEYYKVKLTDVMVTSVNPSANGMGETMVEQVVLSFSKVELEYTPQSGKGTGEGTVKFGWDVAKNQKV
jgi:type VI secretion system secreted protein Hcp